MTAEHLAAPPSPHRSRLPAARVLVAILSALAAITGVYATLDPHNFYHRVIGVDLLGPYNQHLLTDVGGLYLGFAITLGWAAGTQSRQLIRVSCAGFATTQALHLLYHALHLQHFTLAQAIGQTVGLGAFLILPLTAVALTCERIASPIAQDRDQNQAARR